jgi:RHS repeat-associated protein
MFAGSQTDMCVGLDIHMEMVPTPAPVPTPFPMPFVGEVEYSAVGVLMGMGIGKAMSFFTGSPPTGPVVVNGFQCVKTGDEAKNKETLPHFVIPPGTAWTPLPKPLKLKISPPPPAPDNPAAPPGDAVFITGSKTVLFEQSSACRLGTLAMSCSDPVRLPSSVLLAVPKGLPVLLGGPDAIDWMAAAKAFFLRNKWTAGLLHQLVSLLPPGRFQNLLDKAVCMLTGHPVDVATGRLLTWSEDFVLRGPIPLPFERNYSSAWAERNSTLGFGWSHTFDERIWVERGRVVYLKGDGRELEFHTHELPGRSMVAGQELFYPIDRLTLRCLGKGRWAIRSTDGLLREFEIATGGDQSTSQIARIVDRHDHEVRFLYSGGYLERVETSEGRTVRFEHRGGRLARICVPAGQVDGWYDQLRLEYSAQGDLVTAFDSANRTKTYAYEEHLLVRETNRDGLTFWFEYDGTDSTARCVRTWGADGSTTDRLFFRDITYDRAALRTFVEDSLGNTTTYIMNAANAVVAQLEPNGARTEFEYDDHLWKTSETDPAGNTTRFAYDKRGNKVQSRYADEAEVALRFNADDQPVWMRDLLGCEWRWLYDSRGRMVRATNTAGEDTRFVFEKGVLRSMIRSDERSLSFAYDEQENLSRIVRADGSAEERWYDRQGRIIKIRDAIGRVWRATHDGESRVVSLEAPGRYPLVLHYAGEGALTEYRTALRRIAFGYCGTGQVAWREEAGVTTRYGYSTEDELVSVRNELGELYTLERDVCQRVVRERTFDGREHNIQRDSAGRVVAFFRPRKSEQRLEYDSRNRVAVVKYSDGQQDEFSYDAAGHVVSARNALGTVQRSYDTRGRMVREAFGDDWVESHYDLLGRRTGLKTSRGLEQRLTVSPLGPWTAVAATAASAADGADLRWDAQVDRDVVGREIRRRLPGDISLSVSYDERDLPIKRTVQRRSTPLEETELRWAEDDQLRSIVSSDLGLTEYTHDGRGRLFSRARSDSTQFLAPGPTGNVHRDAARQDRRYGRGGVLLSTPEATFTYDADGNQSSRLDASGNEWRYGWNAAGLLTDVLSPDGARTSFSYDALGRRVSRTLRHPSEHDEEVTQWLWDGDVPAAEFLAGSDEVTNWLFEPTSFRPLAKLTSRGGFSVVCDFAGTAEEMFDEAGALAWKAQLDLYGKTERISPNVEDCPWRRAGQYADSSTGLYYNRFRYFDPDRGTYISQDPVGLKGGLPPYAYVADPIVELDPLGLSCIQANQAQGKAAEAAAVADINADPTKTLLGQQVTASVPGLGARRIDILYLDNATNQIVALEVKSGQAVYDGLQVQKDLGIMNGAATLVGQRAADAAAAAGMTLSQLNQVPISIAGIRY